MKKVLLITLSCLTLFACKKGEEQKEESTTIKRFPISFKVDEFTKTVGTAPTKTTTAAVSPSTAVDNLQFIVFDSNGNQVSRLEQTSADYNKLFRIVDGKKLLMNDISPYGQFNDTLAAGNYTVLISGGPESSSFNALRVLSGAGGFTHYIDSYAVLPLAQTKFYPFLEPFDSEVFFTKSTFSVSSTYETKNFTLNRLVGQVSIVFEDGIPANVNKLEYSVDKEYSYWSPNTNTVGGTSATYKTASMVGQSEKGTPNYTRKLFILNNQSPITITVKAYDVNNTVLYSKTITNIPVATNQKTTVTGKMFTATATGNRIDVNTDWVTTVKTVTY